MTETIIKNLNIEHVEYILSKLMYITNKTSLQRMFVSQLGITAFSDYLEENGLNSFSNNNLHSICPISEELDIADIVIENNIIIDARTVCDDLYPQMCIPKEHFIKGIQADIYVGIKINKNLDQAEFIGFIKTDNINKEKGNKNYYLVDIEELTSVSSIKSAVNSIEKSEKTYTAVDHEKAAALFIPFIDKIISEDDKNFLIAHLFGCNECRKSFINLFNLNHNLIKIKEKLLIDEDYSLRLFSGDPVLAGKEVSIEIEKEAVFEVLDDEELEKEEIIASKLPEIEEVKEEAVFEVLDDEELEKEEIIASKLSEIKEVKEEAVFEVLDDEELEKKEVIAFKLPEIEEVKEELPKKRRHLDWAEELTDDSPVIETPKTISLHEEPEKLEDLFSEEETPVNLSDNLPELVLSDHKIKEKDEKLDESIIGSEKDQKTIIPKINDPDIKAFFEDKTYKKEEIIREKTESLFSDEKNEEMENILDILEDVEIINEEDDIDSLFSFIDSDSAVKTVASQETDSEIPALEEPPVSESKKEPPVFTEKKGDYSTVLYSEKKTEEDTDFLIYEEGQDSVNIMNQEELLNIFEDTADENLKNNKREKAKLKFFINTLLKDKNMLAFTAAITLSTTVVFLYLGQINKQFEIKTVNLNNNNPETNNLENINNKHENQNSSQNPEENENEETSAELRKRSPLRSYTREVIKTVKKEKKFDPINGSDPNKKDLKDLQANNNLSLEKLKEINTVEIKNISWELSAAVAREPKIKKYFLDAGYLIKENLSKDLYIPGIKVQNTLINIHLELDSKGKIITNKISSGSGSDKVDQICLKALSDIIKNKQFPEMVIKKDKIKLKLVIKV